MHPDIQINADRVAPLPSLEATELVLFMLPAIGTMTDRQIIAMSEFVDWIRARQNAAERARLFPDPVVIDFAGAQHHARRRASTR